MGVTYKEIEEMIETGETSSEASKAKILEMHEKSAHKRDFPPIYTFERKSVWKN